MLLEVGHIRTINLFPHPVQEILEEIRLVSVDGNTACFEIETIVSNGGWTYVREPRVKTELRREQATAISPLGGD